MNGNSTPNQFNLNSFNAEVKEGISLITAVKNRKDILEAALKTWLTHDEIDEIIVVDWASDDSIISMVNDFKDNRIVLVIAENQKRWIQTKAFNLGARFSTKNKIMKIDGDIKVHKGFFDNHPLKEGIFYTGNWALGRNSNETHLNGTTYLFRNDFFHVNGYNELLKLYGYDDTDLYARLENAGLQRLDFNNDYLYHIEHESRVSAPELSDNMDKLTDSQKAEISILMNRHLLSQSYSWSTDNQMINMNVEKIDKNLFLCKNIQSTEPVIPDEVLLNSLKTAMKERLHMNGQEFSERLFETGSRNEIIDLYYIFHHKNEVQTYESIFNLLYNYDQSVSKELLEKENEIKFLIGEHQIQNEKINEFVRRVDSIYLSYSWRLGHSIFSTLNNLAFWVRKS